jgi:hypothetical protein
LKRNILYAKTRLFKLKENPNLVRTRAPRMEFANWCVVYSGSWLTGLGQSLVFLELMCFELWCIHRNSSFLKQRQVEILHFNILENLCYFKLIFKIALFVFFYVCIYLSIHPSVYLSAFLPFSFLRFCGARFMFPFLCVLCTMCMKWTHIGLFISRIWGSHGGEYEDCCLLGCSTV